jgi:dTDP-4-amino-4,6-dideoxygalactose transaminase
MNIPFLDLKEAHSTALRKDIKSRISDIIDSAYFAQGPVVAEFEERFAEFLGGDVKTVATSSGTASLELALRAADIGPGDEVIVTSLTWVATHLAILNVGATPVVIDVELDTFTIDPQLIWDVLNCNTKAIMPVHICGNPSNMKDIMDIADERDLIVIEDACQAHGAEAHLGMGEYEKVGSIGHMGCFSFFPTKNLGGIGEGGLVATSDPELLEKLKALRLFGKDGLDRDDPGVVGGNYKMDEIRAAALIAKMDHLETWQKKRNGIATMYKETVDEIDSMFFQQEEHGDSVYHLFSIMVKDPIHFQAFLEQDKGIGTARYYNTLPHNARAIRDRCIVPQPTPNASHIGTHSVYIPCQPYLKKYEADYICEAIAEYIPS